MANYVFGNIFFTDCTSDTSRIGVSVLRQPMALVNILKQKLWLKFVDPIDRPSFAKNRVLLMQQYDNFKAKYGSMTEECRQILLDSENVRCTAAQQLFDL